MLEGSCNLIISLTLCYIWTLSAWVSITWDPWYGLLKSLCGCWIFSLLSSNGIHQVLMTQTNTTQRGLIPTTTWPNPLWGDWEARDVSCLSTPGPWKPVSSLWLGSLTQLATRWFQLCHWGGKLNSEDKRQDWRFSEKCNTDTGKAEL